MPSEKVQLRINGDLIGLNDEVSVVASVQAHHGDEIRSGTPDYELVSLDRVNGTKDFETVQNQIQNWLDTVGPDEIVDHIYP